MNSPPLSWIHLSALGYRANQVSAIFLATCSDFLFFILVSSTRLLAMSIIVRALNSTTLLPTGIFQGPIRSTAISENGSVVTSRSGNSPHCLGSVLYFSQCSHLNFLLSACTYLLWYLASIVFLVLSIPGCPSAIWYHLMASLTMVLGTH